ncbi:MAG: sensor histidine kinase [Geminicoccaceae bacterium]
MLAGGIGLLTYHRIESAFRDVSDQKIPAMALALQLVERTRAVSSDALTLAASSNPEQHAEAVAVIVAHKGEMRRLLTKLSSSSAIYSKIEPVEILVGDLFGALLDLEQRVQERLELVKLRQLAVDDIDLAHGRLLDWLTPKIDDANFDLVIRTEETTNKLGQQIETLTTDGVAILHGALNLRAAVNLLAGIMIEAAVAPNLGVLEATADRFAGTRAAVEAHLADLAEHRRFEALKREIASLLHMGDGDEGIFAIRRRAFSTLYFDPTARPRIDATALAKEVYRPREAILAELEHVIDDASFDLVVRSESAVNESSETINGLTNQSVEALRAYLSIAADGNWLAGTLRQASVERDAAALELFSEQIGAAIRHLNHHHDALEIVDAPKTELRDLLKGLFSRTSGQDGIIALRAAEIDLEKKQRSSVRLTHDLAAMLTQAVNDIVGTARAGVVESSQSVEKAILHGQWLMTGLSMAVLLIAAAIIVREAASRQKLERSAQELRHHHDRLQSLVEERTETISEQAEELQRALNAEKELSGLQRQFVSMVCHEFRTPLAVIDGSAQRLMRRHGSIAPDQQREGLCKIRRSVIRLTDLMESVLSAARLEAGTIRFQPERCRLIDMIEEVSSNHQDVNPDRKILTDLRQLPEMFTLDINLIRQVISNLISNAIKYSPGTNNVWVQGKTNDDGGIEISIRDEGVGIPEDELDKLFQRFFRASTSTGIAGTGIGLHMVKTLVDMHGGQINVASAPGEGTTFTVCLPCRTIDHAKQNGKCSVAA